MKLDKAILFIILVFAIHCSKAQSGSYTLSDDSLVNFHASQKRVYHAVRVEHRPRTDGRLDDPCWATEGEWQGDFIQQTPRQGQRPSQPTQVKILYDDEYLYVAMRCFDSEPEKISPVMGRRDDFTSGDVVGIALDTYHDRHTAFEFNVTAAGQKVDVMHLGAYEWDTNWDAVWTGKAALEDSAWTAEIRIPFSQLRFSDQQEHVWGMHIWRWIDRYDEEDQWKLIPIDAPAMVYLFGELHGIRDIPRKRHFELMPFTAARHVTDATSSDRFALGLDGKAALSSNFTLDFTVLPDFGQVEADPSELNLTTYEVFYSEKRPFFLEGNAILDYSVGNDMMFYSRRIGHAPTWVPPVEEDQELSMPSGTAILNALKVTGKNRKGFSLGVVNSMTGREFATITGPGTRQKTAVEPFANYFIGRARQDFNNGNTLLGVMGTSVTRSLKEEHLEFMPRQATAGALDFRHNWAEKKYFIDARIFVTSVAGSTEAITALQRSSRHYYQRIDATHLTLDSAATSLSGFGGQIKGGKQSGKLRLTGTLSWRSPGVELNDAGYLRDADLISQRTDLRYQVNKPAGIMRSWYVDFIQKHERTFGNHRITDHLNLHGYIKFTNLWNLHADMVRNFGKSDPRQLRGGPALYNDPYWSGELFAQTNSARKIFAGAGMYRRWVDGGEAGSVDYTLYLQWKINNRIFLTSTTKYEDLTDNSQYVTRRNLNGQPLYIVGQLERKTLQTTLRAEYFITPELSLQYYGNPYASVGHYRKLYKVEKSLAKDPESRYTTFGMLSRVDGLCALDLNGDQVPEITLADPDFDFREFRSNFVLRWEYLAGSTLYLVWSHNSSAYDYIHSSSIIDSFKGIGGIKGTDALMVKLSYWFSL